MDKDLYRIMQKIREKEEENAEKYKKFKVYDVVHKGKIKTIEVVNGVDTEVEKDIFEVIEIMLKDEKDADKKNKKEADKKDEKDADNTVIVKNYYDENINYLAGCDKDGQMYPAKEPIAKDIDLNRKIEEIAKAPGLSLNEIDKVLEKLAKELGVEKEEVLLSQIDLEQKIGQKENEKDDKKLKLNEAENEKEDSDEQIKSNENVLKNINTKTEINANQRVDNRHTIADIMGAEPGSKLYIVYTDAIKGAENTTRYSIIMKKPDGTLERPNILEQTGGRYSNRKAEEINYNGDKVTQQSAISSYKINSSIMENANFLINVGDDGRPQMIFAKEGRTEKINTVGIKCKDSHSKENREKVLDELGEHHGRDNIEDDKNEIAKQREEGFEDNELDDADGKEDTNSDEFKKFVVEKIKSIGTYIEDVYGDGQILETYEEMKAKKPSITIEDVAEELDAAAKHYITRGTRETR